MKKILLGLLFVTNSVFCNIEINPGLFNPAGVLMGLSMKNGVQNALEALHGQYVSAIKSSDAHVNEKRLALLKLIEQDASANCRTQSGVPAVCDEFIAFVQGLITVSEERKNELGAALAQTHEPVVTESVVAAVETTSETDFVDLEAKAEAVVDTTVIADAIEAAKTAAEKAAQVETLI